MRRTAMSVDEAVSRVKIMDLFAKYCHAVRPLRVLRLRGSLHRDDLVADYSEVRGPELEPILHSRAAFASGSLRRWRTSGPGMTHYMSKPPYNCGG